MIESTTGLILHTRPLTETSLIVHWLTRDFGRIGTVAKGARRAKSPFLGKLDLFYLADFSFSRSRRSELHTLREVGLRDTHNALRQDLARLKRAAYAAALIEQATETGTPLPAVFELMQGFLACLCRQPSPRQLVFAFELKFLRELGLQPKWAKTRLAAGTKKIAVALTLNDWESGLHLKPTGPQAAELSRFLHGFLIYHLERLPPGRAATLAE